MKKGKKEMNIEKKMLIVVIILIAIICINKLVSAEVIDQNNYKGHQIVRPTFRTYTVRKGETLSEIAWVIGVKMNDLVNWNDAILKNGIRNLQTGMKLRYLLPKDTASIAVDSINAINQTLIKNSQLISREIAAINKSHKNAALSAEEKSEKKIDEAVKKILEKSNSQHKTTQKTIKGITKVVKDEVARIIQGNENNTTTIMSKIVKLSNSTENVLNLVRLSIILLICLGLRMLILLFFSKKKGEVAQNHNHNDDNNIIVMTDDPDESNSNPNQSNKTEKILNQDRLNSVPKKNLSLKKEEMELNFSLKGIGDFSASLSRNDDGKIEVLFISPDGKPRSFPVERRKNIKDSVRGSFRNYLHDTCDELTANRIESLIKNGKIVKC